MTRVSNRSRAFCWLLVSVAVSVAVARPTLAQTGTFLDKLNQHDVRVVSYNLGGFNDGFSDQPFNFTGGQWRFDDHYARVVDALDADVWAFQEIQSRTAADVQSALNLADPLPGGGTWFTYKRDEQVLASRHPFSATFANVFGSPRSPTVATVDLPDAMSASDFHFINIHLKAGGSTSDESQRIAAMDRIIQYLREAQIPGGQGDLEASTPFVVLGDYNTAAGINPVLNLLNGNIQNEVAYGPDDLLDWDGTTLSAVQAFHNVASGLTWTWRSGSSTSRLDYQVYSDSVARLAQAFVLNTQLMTSAERNATGLESDDVLYTPGSSYWDHLPLVVDYNLRTRVIPEPAVPVVIVLAGLIRRRRGCFTISA